MIDRTVRSAFSALLLLTGVVTACAPMQARESATAEQGADRLDDPGITAKIKAELMRDKGLPGTQIRVETTRNVVQLSGFVDTIAQKAKAEQIARQASGVQDVRNDIIVR